MLVKLLAPHFIHDRWLPAETVLTLPPQVAPTPLMVGLDPDAESAVAESRILTFGRVLPDGSLLDNPPIERPIWDPQPEPPIPNRGGPGR